MPSAASATPGCQASLSGCHSGLWGASGLHLTSQLPIRGCCCCRGLGRLSFFRPHGCRCCGCSPSALWLPAYCCRLPPPCCCTPCCQHHAAFCAVAAPCRAWSAPLQPPRSPASGKPRRTAAAARLSTPRAPQAAPPSTRWPNNQRENQSQPPPAPTHPPAHPTQARPTFFTIFCSSTRKARTMRSLTTPAARWPPYARCTVFLLLLMRCRELGRTAGSCAGQGAGARCGGAVSRRAGAAARQRRQGGGSPAAAICGCCCSSGACGAAMAHGSPPSRLQAANSTRSLPPPAGHAAADRRNPLRLPCRCR